MERYRVAVSVVVAALALATSRADATPVSSTFDSGLDGWTLASGAVGEIAWGSSGGNPGGYLQYRDGLGVGSRIVAPPKFLGDWSALDGVGAITYDHSIFVVGTGPVFRPYTIEIAGPGGRADWHGATPSGVTAWPTSPNHTVTALLDESQWSVETGSWSALLANVTELRIGVESVDNVWTPGMQWVGLDKTGVDNVYLGSRTIPAPGAAVLCALGLGLVGPLCRRKVL